MANLFMRSVRFPRSRNPITGKAITGNTSSHSPIMASRFTGSGEAAVHGLLSVRRLGVAV
jgi:hypothetical protein